MTFVTDAGDVQINYALLQEQPNKPKKPIGYSCSLLTGAERLYDTTQRECLSFLWAVLLPTHYLPNSRFTIRADHGSLKCILSLSEACRKIASCLRRLIRARFSCRSTSRCEGPSGLSIADITHGRRGDDIFRWRFTLCQRWIYKQNDQRNSSCERFLRMRRLKQPLDR